MQFARINGIALHHQVINAPPVAPVVVFVNALGADFRIWRDVLVRLVGQVTLLTYDMRGHGLSDVGEVPYSLDILSDDLAGLLDHCGYRDVIVVGLSVGGLVAQRLAATRPDLVRALVLSNSAARIGDDASWAQRIAAIEAGGIEAIADAVLERWFTPGFRDPANAELIGYRNMLIRQPRAGYLGTCHAIREADLTADAARIVVPTLCVVGDQDGSTPPETVLALARSIPGARYELIRNCGHIPSIEQPSVFTEILRAFLDIVRATPGPSRH